MIPISKVPSLLPPSVDLAALGLRLLLLFGSLFVPFLLPLLLLLLLGIAVDVVAALPDTDVDAVEAFDAVEAVDIVDPVDSVEAVDAVDDMPKNKNIRFIYVRALVF